MSDVCGTKANGGTDTPAGPEGQGCRPETGAVQIAMGALAPKFSEQPIAARLSPEELDKFQFIADALTVVMVHSAIPYSVGTKARDKLAKKMFKAMRATPNSQVGTMPEAEATGGEVQKDTP